MADKISTVLLAGIGRGPFKAIAPVLDRHHVKIEHITEPEDAVALAFTKPFDLVIFDADPERLGLAELVGRLRTPGCASRICSLLVVAGPGAGQEARGLIGRGVNRVVTLDMNEEIIEQHVADLLDVAPRAAVRFKARLTTVLEDGKVEIIGRTENVSVTGMLLETTATVDIGQMVAFEFLANGGDEMVSGVARVVRHAVAERGGVDGIGLRFLEFHGDGRERIEAVLTQACVSS